MTTTTTTTADEKPTAGYGLKLRTAVPPLLELLAPRERNLFPFAALQRVQFEEPKQQLTLTFIAERATIRGKGLEEIYAALAEWKQITFYSEPETAAIKGQKVVIDSIEVLRRKAGD